jgi:hypothetical protein
MRREIRPPHISYEQSVSGERDPGTAGAAPIGHDNADAFQGMAGGLEKFEAAVAELDGIAIADGTVDESRAGAFAQIDAGAGALGEFTMAGNEVGVEMGFDDVLDPCPVAGRGFQVYVYVALGIDDRRYSSGTDEVRRVGEAAEIKTLDLDSFHSPLLA